MYIVSYSHHFEIIYCKYHKLWYSIYIAKTFKFFVHGKSMTNVYSYELHVIIAVFYQLHVTKIKWVGLQTEPLMQHLSYLTHKQHITDVAHG